MYGLRCARCGQKEVFHNLIAEINEGHIDPELDKACTVSDYGEDLDGYEDILGHVRGFRARLQECTGFVYGKKISEKYLVERAIDYPGTIYFIDEELARKARKNIEDAEEKRLSETGHLYGQVTTYIVPMKNGRTVCYVGE